MSNIIQLKSKQESELALSTSIESQIEEASGWIAKLDRGLSRVERNNLRAWLSLEPSNMDAFLDVALIWDKMSELNRLSDLFPQNRNTVSHSKRWVAGIAASVLLVATLGLFSFEENKRSSNDAYHHEITYPNQLETSIGESTTNLLSDGSKLVLNTNTKVNIKYSKFKRIIVLTKGEIHIDVAHDTSRPLSVVVGKKVIQAVGTAFNVEVQNDSIELIVTDGKVLVVPLDERFALEDISDYTIYQQADASMAVRKGEKVDLSFEGENNQEAIKVEPVEIAASLSWRNGNLIFRGESLEEVMVEISRYSDVNFLLDDNPDLRKIKVAGMFKTGDISGLLSILKQNFHIENNNTDDGEILLSLAEKG
ncbi:MAG: FecR domain-containing protein [Kangiellaceae bacterium]|nr:FecR domain-containing protein [Kangiellaceae bacterium]